MTTGLKGTLKSTKIKVQPKDLVSSSYSEKVAGVRLVDHVSAKLRDSDLEVPPVLSVQLDVPIGAEEGNLAVVVAQHPELDHFAVDASFALHRQVRRLKDLDFGRIDTRCNQEMVVRSYSESLGAHSEVEVLNQVDSVGVLLEVFEFALPLLGFLHVLWDGLATGQVVDFDSVQLMYFHFDVLCGL